jgi:hypothetical protein
MNREVKDHNDFLDCARRIDLNVKDFRNHEVLNFLILQYDMYRYKPCTSLEGHAKKLHLRLQRIGWQWLPCMYREGFKDLDAHVYYLNWTSGHQNLEHTVQIWVQDYRAVTGENLTVNCLTDAEYQFNNPDFDLIISIRTIICWLYILILRYRARGVFKG